MMREIDRVDKKKREVEKSDCSYITFLSLLSFSNRVLIYLTAKNHMYAISTIQNADAIMRFAGHINSSVMGISNLFIKCNVFITSSSFVSQSINQSTLQS